MMTSNILLKFLFQLAGCLLLVPVSIFIAVIFVGIITYDIYSGAVPFTTMLIIFTPLFIFSFGIGCFWWLYIKLQGGASFTPSKKIKAGLLVAVIFSLLLVLLELFGVYSGKKIALYYGLQPLLFVGIAAAYYAYQRGTSSSSIEIPRKRINPFVRALSILWLVVGVTYCFSCFGGAVLSFGPASIGELLTPLNFANWINWAFVVVAVVPPFLALGYIKLPIGINGRSD